MFLNLITRRFSLILIEHSTMVYTKVTLYRRIENRKKYRKICGRFMFFYVFFGRTLCEVRTQITSAPNMMRTKF